MKLIQNHLCELLDFFYNYERFLNSHAASFFSKNLWNNMLPANFLQDVENMTKLDNFPNEYLDYVARRAEWDCELFPEVGNYLKTADRLSLKNSTLITSTSQLESLLSSCEKGDKTLVFDFMSEKKIHEVQKLAELVENITQKTQTKTLVDVGSGKGYMSSTLSYNCGVNVLSLDSSAITACGAKRLDANMGKKLKLHNRGKHVRETLYVSPCVDLEPLLLSHFGESTKYSGLLGLHTCGQLAATSCQLFVQKNMSWFINVGCCYHLLQEKFDTTDFWQDFNSPLNGDVLFPMSSFLTKKKVRLGRNARMVAAHCLEKIAHDGMNEKSFESLFFRAILQVVVEKLQGHDVQEGQIGRLYRKCNSFSDYMTKAMEKLQLKHELSEDEIQDLLRTYKEKEINLKVYLLLRNHLAPVVETIILLDRVLFLMEQGVKNVHLVPLFEPHISPRNHAIVAWRTNS